MSHRFSATLRVASAALALHVAPESAPAQVLASQPGMVSQTVDNTTITVEYHRPVARGRELFGGVVHWGERWTPGANWATTLEVDRDVKVNGQPLPKGKYSVWMEPQRDSAWTVAFVRRARIFHTRRPSSDEDQLRIAVKPEQGPHVEVLTFNFTAVMRDATSLRLQWGTTVVPMLVSVEPSRRPESSASERERYVGRWLLTFVADSGRARPAQPDSATIEVVQANGALRVRGNPIEDQFDETFDLIPIGGHHFHPSYYKSGQPFGLELAETFVFDSGDGPATTLEVRGSDDRPFARGRRIR